MHNVDNTIEDIWLIRKTWISNYAIKPPDIRPHDSDKKSFDKTPSPKSDQNMPSDIKPSYHTTNRMHDEVTVFISTKVN